MSSTTSPIKATVLLILGLFSTCAWSQPTKVTLQLKWDHQFQFAGYYAALAKGYYGEEGLDVDIKSRVTSDGKLLNVFDELSSGRADFIVAGPDLIIGIDKGCPAKIIATFSQSSPYAFITRNGEFNSPAEFSDKRINITEPYWGPVELHAIVTLNGGNVNDIVKSSHPPSLQLLIDNKVDVISTYIESATYQMQEMGVKFDIFRSSDYGIHLYGDTLLAANRLIESNPEVVAAFHRATLKGWRYAHENPEEISQLINDEYTRVFDWYDDFVGYNIHQSKIMKQLAYYPTVTIGHTSVERWQKTIGYFENAGFITHPIKAEDIIYDPTTAGQLASKKQLNILIVLLSLILLVTLLTIIINRSLKRKVDEKTRDLQALNASLEDKVTQRTEELETAKEKALRLADAKTEFTTNMSHEIRTPLNAVIGLSELALRTSDTGKQWDYLKKINTSAKALLLIINDILDLSKIEAGKLETQLEPFNFPDFIAEINDIFRYAAETKGLQFIINQDDFFNTVIVSDPTRLKQILVNLIGNAIKFTHQGEISLTIKSEKHHDQDYLLAVIEDTGIGIGKEDLEKLFTPFEQADNSIARKFGGTGLGLSICKNLAELMGGNIYAESEPDKGSRFIVSIPYGVADSQQTEAIILRSQHANQIPVFSGIQALIIEDQPLNREVIIGILSECNIQCQEADNGQSGIEMNKAQHFDIIFLDIQMPGLDGFQTLEKLREHPTHREDIVIAMTAHAQSGYDSFCLEKGFTGYISKPIDTMEVYQTLTQYFQPDNFKNAFDRQEVTSATPASEPINEFDEALIDIKSGIKRLRGKEDRYQSLLKDFISRQPNLVQRLTEHIGRNDTQAAKAFAHEMKGSTGNLSLDSLHYCLEDLEQALINNDLKETHQKLVDLGRAWRITEREVKKYLSII